MREIYAVLTLACRDLLKLLRDPTRLISELMFPLLFIVILGGSLQSSFGIGSNFDYITYIFTGVFAQTLFQSASMGVVSLIDDRENDFSQEVFVSPISRYTIILGKILGETLVAMTQALGILVFGFAAGVRFSFWQLIGLGWSGIVTCLFGAAFGVIILSNLNNRRTADQVFPYIMLPQFFLAGVFNPIQKLPWYLDFLSRIAPMRYAVDLTRDIFYPGRNDYVNAVLQGPAYNLMLMTVAFLVFLFIGTFLFVRKEQNR
ncbi:MAG TPA: ABC transporter permease [Anaerolineales bacterium]|nr:ABC transporter permease [Anaerolineales bacterium]